MREERKRKSFIYRRRLDNELGEEIRECGRKERKEKKRKLVMSYVSFGFEVAW